MLCSVGCVWAGPYVVLVDDGRRFYYRTTPQREPGARTSPPVAAGAGRGQTQRADLHPTSTSWPSSTTSKTSRRGTCGAADPAAGLREQSGQQRGRGLHVCLELRRGGGQAPWYLR